MPIFCIINSTACLFRPHMSVCLELSRPVREAGNVNLSWKNTLSSSVWGCWWQSFECGIHNCPIHWQGLSSSLVATESEEVFQLLLRHSLLTLVAKAFPLCHQSYTVLVWEKLQTNRRVMKWYFDFDFTGSKTERLLLTEQLLHLSTIWM